MAAQLTVPDFRKRYPQFSSVADPQIELAIDDALPWLDTRRWGNFYLQGLASLAAHLVWSSSPGAGAGGAKGPVTSKRAGDIQLSYGTLPTGTIEDAWLTTSIHGQRYIALRRLAGVGAMVAP